MGIRVCEYCLGDFLSSSELVAHYQREHKEEE